MNFSLMHFEPFKRCKGISALVTLPKACYVRCSWMIWANWHKI